MALILKHPNNKPPFIGIGFSSEHALKGQNMHAEIVEKYHEAMYEVHIEHTPGSLNLRLKTKTPCRFEMAFLFW